MHFYGYFDRRLNLKQPIWEDLALVTLPSQLTREHRGALHQCLSSPPVVQFPAVDLGTDVEP